MRFISFPLFGKGLHKKACFFPKLKVLPSQIPSSTVPSLQQIRHLCPSFGNSFCVLIHTRPFSSQILLNMKPVKRYTVRSITHTLKIISNNFYSSSTNSKPSFSSCLLLQALKRSLLPVFRFPPLQYT